MTKSELTYALGWAAAIMAVTLVPYLIAWWVTPVGAVYPWLLFNSDDQGVYYAWMRQARDGHLLFRNLFTNEPQGAAYVHLYFLVLGWVSRLTGLEIPIVYHAARCLFGVVTLVLAYRFAAFFTGDVFARRCAFWTIALSAGLGWLFWSDHSNLSEPIDVWQPEALTFASLYAIGLFPVSLALLLGFVVCMLLAEDRGWKWAAGAGVCGLLLGNTHSYDMIALAAVWAGYLAARWIVTRRFPAREFGLAALAGIIASPSVAYMAWLYLSEPVFRARADTATWSKGPGTYLLGYGLLVPLAVWGGRLLWRGHRPGAWGAGLAPSDGVSDTPPGTFDPRPQGAMRHSSAEGGDWDRTGREGPPYDLAPQPSPVERRSTLHAPLSTTHVLPIVWCVVGIAVVYLPFAFQRKLIEGYHFPLALLAGIAVAELARRVGGRTGRPAASPLVAGLFIALLSVSHFQWMRRDVAVALGEGVTSNKTPVWWPESQVHAWEWLGKNSPPDATLLQEPTWGGLAPTYSGRRIYAGHWGETPDFAGKIREVRPFFAGRISSEERLRFLREKRIGYVLVGPMERSIAEQNSGLRLSGSLEREPFLEAVFREGQTPQDETVLYAVRPGAAG
jgi:hypothetical protein